MTPLRPADPKSLAAVGLTVLCLIVLAGCSSTRVVAHQEMMAPANMDVAMRRDVAIVEFTGDGGQTVSDTLAAGMERVRLDGQPVFTVHGPVRLHTGRAGAIGNVDPAEALDYARSVDARAVIMGQTAYDSDTKLLPPRTTETCNETNSADKCIDVQIEVRQCVEITVTMDFSAQALDTATGSRIYDGRPSRAARSTTQCVSTKDDPAILITRLLNNDFGRSVDNLRAQLAQAAADEIHREIAPFPQTFQVSFLNEPNRLGEAQAARFEEASDLIGNRHTAAACSVWESMTRSGVSDPALAYNMAACAEDAGNYRAAMEAYESVYRAIFHAPHQQAGGAGTAEANYDLDDWAALLDAARARVRRLYESRETLSVLTDPPRM